MHIWNKLCKWYQGLDGGGQMLVIYAFIMIIVCTLGCALDMLGVIPDLKYETNGWY